MSSVIRVNKALDIIVVGAGFAGLYALHLLRGQGRHVQVFEGAGDVGGTWYWNRYPGARCDVQSLVYCYSFDERLQQEWTWSERYATQPEILRYLNFVADRLELRKDIVFNSPIVQAAFDEGNGLWTVTTERGEKTSAKYLIMATGALSVGRLPDTPGIDRFQGRSYHTGEWPREGVNFSGQRVAVIGTGSSGVQVIPMIAQEAQQLTVFQRTPGFVAPACNTPMDAAEIEQFRAQFADYRARLKRGEVSGIGDVQLADLLPPKRPSTFEVAAEERQALMQARWEVGGLIVAHAFADAFTDEAANAVLADFFRAKIREIVKDPNTAQRLTPTGYPIGSKRVRVGTDYYETFNRDNVTLVDVRTSPIEAITPTGLRTTERKYEFDIIVFATGFDALTGALTSVDIRGRDGITLREVWAEGPRSYLGVAIAGFPNLFTVTGPGSPSVLGNVVVSIEQHVEWIAGLLAYARDRGVERIEANLGAQRQWSDHVAAAAANTIFVKGQSWYLGANIPGKPRVFLPYVGGIGAYREICDGIARDGYRGFYLSPPPSSPPRRWSGGLGEKLSNRPLHKLRHLKALMLSRPYFVRIPDAALVVGDPQEGERHIDATRDKNGSYAMVYVPFGQAVTVDVTKVSGTTKNAWWYDPRSGAATRIEGCCAAGKPQRFTPPAGEAQTDWVLVIDDASKGFGVPGASSMAAF